MGKKVEVKLVGPFPMKVKPFRKGPYLRKAKGIEVQSPRYSYWNGEFWGVLSYSPEIALERKDLPSAFIRGSWWGVEK